MSKQLICTWLEIPLDSWPPDHYRLLGLKMGESNPQTIEQHVQQRLEKVRPYQLTHPDSATEAMNRLAQAYVCLTDPESKKAYDAQLSQRPGRLLPTIAPILRVDDPFAGMEVDQIAATATGPAQSDVETQIETPLPEMLPVEELDIVPSLPLREKIDPIIEEARSSGTARRGLGTKRALYHRIARTRQLLHAWESAGKYFGDPDRKVVKPMEATELIQILSTIRTLLYNFPPLIGVAGQPGYLVVSLARQQVVVPTFQTLLPSQREALARDWDAGMKLLSEHRQFLRQEIHLMRKRNPVQRALRAVWYTITDRPGMILLLLALIALNVVLWKQIKSETWQSIFRSNAPVRSDP